ncbi:MAG: hypothetical protein WCA31_03325 [Acidimicrobiales bacterium]
MKKLVSRGLVSLGLVASLGLGTALTASAGSVGGIAPTSGPVASTLKAYRQELKAYNAERLAIEANFRASIALAKSTYEKALSSATTSAERSAAEQTREYAVIEAAATRSTALVQLGNPPSPPSSR